MICAFCQQDVKDPCHNTQEMQQRASDHIDRCEHALEQQDAGGNARRGPSANMKNGGQG